MGLPQFESVVLAEWIDANGHTNRADHVVLVNQTTNLRYDTIGMWQAYREETGNTTFAAETHELYKREIGAGGWIRVVPCLLGADAKRSHYCHKMFHAEDGHRVALQELVVLHIDMSARPATPFPADRSETISTAMQACREPLVPKSVARRKAMPG
jgi:acyl-CoA thioester hydrolase